MAKHFLAISRGFIKKMPMITIMLSNDRTEVDMDRLATAFAKSHDEMDDSIRVGTVTYWFEMGARNRDTPQIVFHSVNTGARVILNSVGDVISQTNKENA
jgi:hypothetical protein